MIKLTSDFVITNQTLVGDAVAATNVTDTLFISEVRLDFVSGAIYASIKRGTIDAIGNFWSNYPGLDVAVNADGSFISTDGAWTGSLGDAVGSLVAQLKAQFDQFILSTYLVTGSAA